MKRILMFACVAFLATTSASLSAGGLPYDPRTASCEVVFENIDYGPSAKLLAASTYYHGMVGGVRCPGGPDVIRSFEIYTELGQTRQIETLIREIQKKADFGNLYSILLLRRLKQAGYVQ